MNQHQILKNRATNNIETLKFHLSKDQEMPLFNDLQIIKCIVPNLPKQTLRDLLHQLKPLSISIIDGQYTNISLSGIFRLLSQVSDCDPLLEDFLRCAGYVPYPMQL